jgi:hypothetical protein
MEEMKLKKNCVRIWKNCKPLEELGRRAREQAEDQPSKIIMSRNDAASDDLMNQQEESEKELKDKLGSSASGTNGRNEGTGGGIEAEPEELQATQEAITLKVELSALSMRCVFNLHCIL